MAKVFLLFGGNLADPVVVIRKAAGILENKIGDIIIKSASYESEPWGFEHENNFINQVIVYESNLKSEEILEIILETEKSFGRTRNAEHYSARIIDIDILFYNSKIINLEHLIIPHPRIQERRFVLEPLSEIEADFIHPVLGKTIAELLEQCNDTLKVSKIT